ncbi:hypothetical protein BTUL_0041g00330 [Botrytis tulipae]|uniref:Uncharacterized protein n=1 Tax=Botrytis tulipae TaxID=87230 RepID=A0A4Z1EV93_9HELO|nr:hypothetical protein BTUL_0041g00330 [Botrytis tulipae]
MDSERPQPPIIAIIKVQRTTDLLSPYGPGTSHPLLRCCEAVMKLGSSDVGQAPVTATKLKENDEEGEMHRRYSFAKKESAVAGLTFMKAVARAFFEA